ncbi:4670_t:CDS:2 [Funneliformis geosporum]|nr:4670_t:CDS:2 [Funneliformis geosporum]
MEIQSIVGDQIVKQYIQSQGKNHVQEKVIRVFIDKDLEICSKKLSRKKHKRNKEDKTKSSKRHQKTKLELAKQAEKVANQRKDFAFKEVNKIVEREKVKNKVVETGQKVVKVNPAYTSQTCSRCNKRHLVKLEKSNRVFICVYCGLVLDRDVNSALNCCYSELLEAATSISGDKKTVSALHVSHYLLSLDKNRRYFTSKRMSPEEEDMIAYRNGAVVENVSKSFLNELFILKSYSRANNLDLETKSFLKAKFEYFQGYSDHELQDLSHEDPSWQLAREKGDNILMSRERVDVGNTIVYLDLKYEDEDDNFNTGEERPFLIRKTKKNKVYLIPIASQEKNKVSPLQYPISSPEKELV